MMDVLLKSVGLLAKSTVGFNQKRGKDHLVKKMCNANVNRSRTYLEFNDKAVDPDSLQPWNNTRAF